MRHPNTNLPVSLREQKKVIRFMDRKVYDLQFKMAAVQLYRWISEYEAYEESAFPDRGSALYNSQY